MRYGYEPGSDLRIQVTPRDAEVYLDGYLVGTVDDFDGMLQRLRVPYGEHDVELYREGYRPVRQKMLFRPGEVYRIKQGMEPVATGEQTHRVPCPRSDRASNGPTRAPVCRRDQGSGRPIAPTAMTISDRWRSASSRPTPSSRSTASAGIVPKVMRGCSWS